MIELFSLHEAELLLLYVLTMVSFVIQTLYTASTFISRKEKIFEIILALYLGFLSAVIRGFLNGYQSGRINSLHYELFHSLFLLVILYVAIATYRKDRKYRMLSAIALIALSFPIISLPFGMFSRIFFIGEIGFLLRGIWLYYFDRRWRKNNMTPYTFKESFDTQHIGVLFFDKNYNILLINQRMQALIGDILGRKSRNIQALDQKLQHQDSDESTLIYEASDGIIWNIAKTPIRLGSRQAFQLTATDITNQAKIISQLSEIEEQLRSQNNELLHTMQNLDEIKKQEALQKSWHYIHDRMGQQVSMIQRLLQSKEKINYEELLTLIGSLEQQFNIEEESPHRLLEEIKQDYRNLGVSVYQIGELPEGSLAKTFVEVIRECVTNAVRHGVAKNITIELHETDGYHTLTVRNDGRVPSGQIVWGGGLSGIANKAKALDGELKIFSQKEFAVMLRVKNKGLHKEKK